MSRTIRIEHLGRVEGHGGITVELTGTRSAKCASTSSKVYGC